MKFKKAFTITESLIAMIVVGILASCILIMIKPTEAKNDLLKKSGANMLLQINFATKQVLAKYSSNYQMTKLLTPSGVEFSINDEGADENLIQIYRRILTPIPARDGIASEEYLSSNLYDENGTAVEDGSALTISSFTQGYKVKNGAYFAIKLDSTCTENKSCIYNPVYPEERDATKSCGLIFFDVNGQKEPNIVGVDQYIISIDKHGN